MRRCGSWTTLPQTSSVALVRERHPWVQLETPGENLGFVQGNNLVLEAPAGNFHARLRLAAQPDTEICAGATQALLELLAPSPARGCSDSVCAIPTVACNIARFGFLGVLQPLFDLGMLPSRFLRKPFYRSLCGL